MNSLLSDPELIAALRNTPTEAEMDASSADSVTYVGLLQDGVDVDSPAARDIRVRLEIMVQRTRESREAARKVVEILDSPQFAAEQQARAADESGRIVELASGYRSRLMATGFSQAAAEKMTVDYHTAIMNSLRAAAGAA